jgi:alanyl-tRNA synthetase
MTERLYYSDAYLAEFTGRVVEAADGGRRVYLDRTAFYPTSGGQPFDTGALGGRPVVDVVDEGDRVAHLLGEPLGSTGGEVAGRVDWARRFDHMQQHTGQHLLSAVLIELFGLRTVSVHFGADLATLDLDAGAVTREQVVAAEARANALVFENRPVAVSFEEAASAEGLRKAPAREGTLRIVTIEGVDRSACGGTHVRATGEIGPILVRRLDRVRKLARVEFLCGMRAVRRARADYDALFRIATMLSTAPDDAPDVVRAQGERLDDADARRKRLEGEIAAFRARERYDATEPGADGIRRVVDRRDTGALEELRPFAQALAALPRAVFVATSHSPPAILVAASPDSGLDAGRALKAALAAAGGRGGGGPTLAQGSVPDAQLLPRVLESLGA